MFGSSFDLISLSSCTQNISRKVNFFITRNAWGAFSINSHINQHTGQPKVMYNSVKSAQKAADSMSKKRGVHFSFYKCLFCDGYHVGKNRENKIEGYDKV